MFSTLKTLTLAALILAPTACGNGSSTTTGTSSHTTSTAGTGGTGGTGGAAGTGGTTGTGGATTPQKACAEQAQALCALRETCSPGFDVKKSFGTSAVCEGRLAQVCVNGLDAMGTGNSPAHVEACAAAYPGEACVDLGDNNPVAACVPPAGTLATGAACGAAAQCASTYCAVAQYQVCGTCQPLPVVGAACQIQADCGRDLACATPNGATAGTCAAFVAAGGACLGGQSPCQSGLACVGDDPATMTMGTCQAQGTTAGAACDASRNTAPNCDASFGVTCIPTAKGSPIGTCQATKLVAAGAACGNIGAMPITGFAACNNGGLCKKAAPTDNTGTCVAPAADGAACDNDAANGPPCLAPARCVIPSGSPGTSGTCTMPNASTCT
jgi:hypothetical protein